MMAPMTALRRLALLGCVLVLAGCSGGGGSGEGGGLLSRIGNIGLFRDGGSNAGDPRFRTTLKTSRGNRADMVITVRPVSVGYEAAAEAGRFEATKHCIRNFGSSDVAWQVGPDTPPSAVQVVNDTVTFRGRCVG